MVSNEEEGQTETLWVSQKEFFRNILSSGMISVRSRPVSYPVPNPLLPCLNYVGHYLVHMWDAYLALVQVAPSTLGQLHNI